MDKRRQIKVCGLTRESDIDCVVSLGADYCGVIAYEKSPRYVCFDSMPTLLARIPSGKRVYVDVKPSIEKLKMAKLLGFDFFQLHFPSDLDLSIISEWSRCVGKENLWLAPKVPANQVLPKELTRFSDHFLVDAIHSSQYGGTGQSNNWLRYAEWRSAYPNKFFMLAGGLGPENIMDAVSQTNADGFDLNSGVEEAPGCKDQAKLNLIFQKLKSLN